MDHLHTLGIDLQTQSTIDVAVKDVSNIPEALQTAPLCARNKVAHDILDVIQQYGRHIATLPGSDSFHWLGRSKFLERIEAQIEKKEAIKMILPAFPWKSVSLRKAVRRRTTLNNVG